MNRCLLESYEAGTKLFLDIFYVGQEFFCPTIWRCGLIEEQETDRGGVITDEEGKKLLKSKQPT